MTLVDQNRVSAAVQRTRLLTDWLRGYIGLLPTWRADYFERAAQNATIRFYRREKHSVCPRRSLRQLAPEQK
jgi:hypothetical protein